MPSYRSTTKTPKYTFPPLIERHVGNSRWQRFLHKHFDKPHYKLTHGVISRCMLVGNTGKIMCGWVTGPFDWIISCKGPKDSYGCQCSANPYLAEKIHTAAELQTVIRQALAKINNPYDAYQLALHFDEQLQILAQSYERVATLKEQNAEYRKHAEKNTPEPKSLQESVRIISTEAARQREIEASLHTICNRTGEAAALLKLQRTLPKLKAEASMTEKGLEVARGLTTPDDYTLSVLEAVKSIDEAAQV